jgi:hypothetical protein
MPFHMFRVPGGLHKGHRREPELSTAVDQQSDATETSLHAVAQRTMHDGLSANVAQGMHQS